MINCLQGCEWWKIRTKIGGSDLIKMFGSDDILQTAFPHIAQFCLVRQSVFYQIIRGLRKQDLAAMSNRHDPLGQRQRSISFIRGTLLRVILQLRCARVDAHSYFDRSRRPQFTLQSTLCNHCSVQCISGSMERRRKRVTNNSESKAVMRFNGLTQNLIVLRKQGWHLVRMFLCEFGAAFDICKEKRDGTCRKICVHGCRYA